MTKRCAYCSDGFLGCGEEHCMNGVRIDIDVYNESYDPTICYPAAPCCACRACKGTGVNPQQNADTDDCQVCNGTGWASGREESQRRLASDVRTAREETSGERLYQ